MPHLPFFEALAPWIRLAPAEEIAADVGQGAQALTAIFPELADRLPIQPAATSLPPEQARLRLFEAIGHALASLASRRPLVLLLDDLQCAYTASLDLLAYTAGHSPCTLLFLGAYRDHAIQTHPALERALVRLQRTNRPESISIEPLDQAQTAQLASRLLGSALAEDSARELQAHSDGNPFFAEELLRGWRHAGALRQTPAGWTLLAESAGAIPASILSAVACGSDDPPIPSTLGAWHGLRATRPTTIWRGPATARLVEARLCRL
jgi:hypothetical protein